MSEQALTLAGADGPLSAETTLVDGAAAMLVLAHGAGAGYRHDNMLAISRALAGQGIASLRFNFPFMEHGRRRVDGRAAATAAIATAVAAAERLDLPVFLGGHSFGGRMASHAVQDHPLAVRGLVFCAFPLHPVRRPSTERAEHLPRIDLPMLFLSGTRDGLADRRLLAEMVSGLGERSSLHWLDTADHSYRILKRRRTTELDVFEEMALAVGRFVEACG